MSIKLNAQSGGSVALDAPTQTTSSADLTFKLPVADGSANQVLNTNGSGQLAFATLATGKIAQVLTQIYEPASDVSTSNTAYQDTAMTLTITPTNTNSKILIFGVANGHRVNNSSTNSCINIKRAVSGGSTDFLAGPNLGIAHTYETNVTTSPIFFVDGTTGTAQRTYTVCIKTNNAGYIAYIFRGGTCNPFMLMEIS
jgi:hypothetical protein